MTRINIVPVAELMDQHLFAEFREIKMVPMALRRSLRTRNAEEVLERIPAAFTLGKGHVMFFYNKGAYLRQRYEQLKQELALRGLGFSPDSMLDAHDVQTTPMFDQDWVPSVADMSIVRQRIREKIDMRPGWYRYSRPGGIHATE